MNLTEWNARLHGLVIFRALLDEVKGKKVYSAFSSVKKLKDKELRGRKSSQRF